MASVNPFDLLGDDDNDEPSQLIAALQRQKVAAAETAAPAAGGKKSPAAPAAAKMPMKPVPPSQAVREARNPNSGPPRGGAGRGGPGRGRGGAGVGPNRDFGIGNGNGNGNGNGFTGGYGSSGGAVTEEGEGGKPFERSRGVYGPPRQSFRGGRRGGYGSANGEVGGDTEHPPRRVYERRSGTGRGYEMKREGAGRANWGTVNDDVLAQETEENVNAGEKVADLEKQQGQEDGKPMDGDKENAATEEAAKPEDKEMTLDEYEKIREEKRKALLAMKSEERKVVIDEELEKLQPLSLKKDNSEIFIKLGADKESKKKESEREERAKKHLSINEFLKAADGERYSGGRGRGRGRGDRGGRGSFGGGGYNTLAAPAIEDPGQFPTLGGK